MIGDESYFDARRTAPGWKPWFTVNECAPISALVVDDGLHYGYPTRYPAHAAAIELRDELRAAGVRVRKRAMVGPRDAPTELAAVDVGAARDPAAARGLGQRQHGRRAPPQAPGRLGCRQRDDRGRRDRRAAARSWRPASPRPGSGSSDGSGLSSLDRSRPGRSSGCSSPPGATRRGAAARWSARWR